MEMFKQEFDEKDEKTLKIQRFSNGGFSIESRAEKIILKGDLEIEDFMELQHFAGMVSLAWAKHHGMHKKLYAVDGKEVSSEALQSDSKPELSQ